MKERPILFSAPMVRAILAGNKTQTRRAVKLPDAGHVKEPRGHRRWHPEDSDAHLACPYGQPGDRLWVRETFFEQVDPLTSKPYDPPRACYRATEYGEVICDDGDGFAEINKDGTFKSPWRPSIHMPRWASRLTLEIVSVRAERLQEIGAEDCIAEGLSTTLRGHDAVCDLRDQYRALWESINGPGSWSANLWVWVVEFKPHSGVEGGADAPPDGGKE